MSKRISPTVLHLRVKLRVPPDSVLAHSREAANKIASLQGLIWKVWLVNREQREIGGVYLFASRESAVAYLNHPVVEALCSNPAVIATDSQIWDVESVLSTITRGPFEAMDVEEQQVAIAGGR